MWCYIIIYIPPPQFSFLLKVSTSQRSLSSMATARLVNQKCNPLQTGSSNDMMLLVDKYRPNTLDRLDYHDEISQQLKTLASTGSLPHMLFYGPSGRKKTRIMALLRVIFGPSVQKIKMEHRTFKTPTNATAEISMMGSNYPAQS